MALKELLVWPGTKTLRLEFSESFGYDLPAAYRSKALNFLVWNQVSYRRPRRLPVDKGSLRQARLISRSMWSGLALATADDDADAGSIGVQQFRQRLHYVFGLIVASFRHFIDKEIAQHLLEQNSSFCQAKKIEIFTKDFEDLRELLSQYAPKPHTVELDVNTFGAIVFGRSLAGYVKLLHAGGTNSRRICHLVHLLEVTLHEGIEGQVRSLSLADGSSLSFRDFLETSQMLAAPIAKILTYLRSPDSFEKVRIHFTRYDPTIFQFILDDLPDYFEDSASGKMGILHALIFAQADLGKKALWAMEEERDSVAMSCDTSMNFLYQGNWSSTLNYVRAGDRQAEVPLGELRCALENCQRDADISFAEVAAKRIDLGRRLAVALDRRDLRECARVLLESNVLRKVISGVWEDQKRVRRIEGVTSKVVKLFPLVTEVLVAKCHLTAWGYRARWRI